MLLIPIALLLLSVTHVSGQDIQQGTVIYEDVSKLDFKLEGEMAHLMKDMPKERRVKQVLYFNREASVYTAKKEDPKDIAVDQPGIKIMMGGQAENILYLDLATKEMTEQKEFMTRTFLIKGEMPSQEWKISGKQKIILDYPCMEAIQTDTAGVVTRAWFAPSIPVQTGPEKYSNLPGMVLEVNIDDGKRTLLAQSIDFDTPVKEFLTKPKNGKKVSKEEFDKIVEEKMKEMGAEGASGGSTIMIKIGH